MPRPRTSPILLIATLLLAAIPFAQAQVRAWSIDPVHTRVVFAVDHAGFSKSLGTFSGVDGVIHFDPRDLASARLDVRIPVASLELGDARWNAATLARNLLDAERHPEARFVSSRVEVLDGQRAVVHGQLTLRGVAREVALETTINAVKRHPMPPFRRTAGFSATTTLRRSDFGIDAWRSMIGDEVELRIEAEATLARGDAASVAADTASTGDVVEADTAAADEAAATPADEDDADDTP
ncbi:polyisoprenoid-binding protein [Luteimonas aestuarii]|uniref:Polyisoprenoid-binding protein n=1 Tax=Luteimonas aestuarii TaxID=453837 RepID=A0A4R5U1A1_9GAMM|nr:YceI family protein [Luteimonas aestuarii]TDK27378.1 polyisoprenoid-binding protein [Luteimonas aestuarii]